MPMTLSRLGRRYLPFVAIAAVQVLLVAVAPSRSPVTVSGQQTSPGGSDFGGNGGAQGAAKGSAAATATGSANSGTSAATGSVPGPGRLAGYGGGVKDLSKCDPKTGKEIGPLTDSAATNWLTPPCLPVFHGRNGGPTMTGVTATTIKFVTFQIHGDPTFNATTQAAGLMSNPEQWCEGQQAFRDEIQKRWELWGRKLVSLDGPGANRGSTQQSPCHYPYFQSQCNAAPADEPCYRAEAKVIASMKPAVVLAEHQDDAFYDELNKDHIIAISTATTPFPLSTYQRAAPYYYGIFMDGTRLANFNAEYWCKKLNNKPAVHAGSDVTSTRNWGPAPGVTPTRKVAVIYPMDADSLNRANVDLFAKRVSGGSGSMCKTPGGVLELGYSQDISTSATQTQTAMNELIQNHITTVMCWCDPLAPLYLTQAAKANNYFPEHLLVGQGLMDTDQLPRLYDQSEWAHAFGLSDLYEMPPFAHSDATKAWQDTGHSGQPPTDQGLYIYPYFFLGTAFMEAGPSPTPAGIHQGLLALGTNGGWAKNHNQHLIDWGLDRQSPWTFAEDVREVYWNQNRPSSVDGSAGSYCPVAGGRRYNPGEFGGGDPVVFNAAQNGC
jgi:hypothetical protein